MRSRGFADRLSIQKHRRGGDIGIAIRFEIDASKAWFTAHWVGPLTDSELGSSYLGFYRAGEWQPGMHEFVDLSDADLSQVTPEGLAGLAGEIHQVFEEFSLTSYKTAVFSPHDLPFGLARLYEAYTFESPETVQVFRDRDEALNWLHD